MLWPSPQRIFSGKAKEIVNRSMEEQSFQKNKQIDVKVENQIKSTMRLNRLEHEYMTEMVRRNIKELKKGRVMKEKMRKGLHHIPESEDEYFQNYASMSPRDTYKNRDISYIDTDLTPEISMDLPTDSSFPTRSNNSHRNKRIMKKSPPIYLTPSNNLFIQHK